MNERIRELKKQAWTLVSEEERARGELYEAREQWDRCDQKFAELIIRKCAEVAWYNTPDWEELEYGHLIEDKILKHFGVEE
jgi:hypothetical protein